MNHFQTPAANELRRTTVNPGDTRKVTHEAAYMRFKVKGEAFLDR